MRRMTVNSQFRQRALAMLLSKSMKNLSSVSVFGRFCIGSWFANAWTRSKTYALRSLRPQEYYQHPKRLAGWLAVQLLLLPDRESDDC